MLIAGVGLFAVGGTSIAGVRSTSIENGDVAPV